MSTPAHTLLLVDALALAYRSFFAIKPLLTTSSGVHTNAVLGFIRAVDQLRALWAPSHAVVVFDGGIPPARRELVPEYKAQRKPMPEELRAQLPILEEYLDAARIPRARHDLQEADDVMASVALRAAGQGCTSLIATGDKDLMQVVREDVSILPAFDRKRLGPAEVLEKTGVRPDQIVDWLALIGDTADNIAGVHGVGEKTAALWLSRYGSIHGIMEHLDELEPARFREVLRGNAALIERNRNMVRLDTSLASGVGLSDLVLPPPPVSSLMRFYEKYEFKSLLKNVSQGELF